MTVGHLNGVEGLGEGTDLVDLDEDGVGGTHLDAFLQELHVGDEEVVAHELAAIADALGEFHPVVPVVLVQSVFDGVDRVFRDELLQIVDLLGCGEFLAVRILRGTVLESAVVIEPLAILLDGELGSGAVHSDLHVLTGLIASLLDGFHNGIESVFDAVEVRGVAAFVTDGGAQAAGLQQLGKVVEHLCTHTDGFLLAAGADRTDHKFLEGDGGCAVGATVHDVHHRHGECEGVAAADIAVEGNVEVVGSCVCAGEGDAEDGVGAEVLFGRGAVEFDHRLVDEALVEDVHSFHHGGDLLVHVGHGFQRAFAEVTALVAVAKFKGFVFSGAGAARDGCPAHNAAFEGYIDLHGRISTRVKNLSCKYFFNNHCFESLLRILNFSIRPANILIITIILII